MNACVGTENTMADAEDGREASQVRCIPASRLSTDTIVQSMAAFMPAAIATSLIAVYKALGGGWIP